jgi:hypothetical protein
MVVAKNEFFIWIYITHDVKQFFLKFYVTGILFVHSFEELYNSIPWNEITVVVRVKMHSTIPVLSTKTSG